MASFVKAATVSEIPPGTGKCVDVNGKEIALFNLDGKFHAIDNTCLHRGGPLGEGEVDGTTVTCPWHGWQYDILTGKNIFDDSGAGVAVYEVRVEGDAVLVGV